MFSIIKKVIIIKTKLFYLVFSIVLIGFTVYTLLDTFVITRVYSNEVSNNSSTGILSEDYNTDSQNITKTANSYSDDNIEITVTEYEQNDTVISILSSEYEFAVFVIF